MPKFTVKYSELVMYEVTFEADTAKQAKDMVTNGEIVDMLETDSQLLDIVKISQE